MQLDLIVEKIGKLLVVGPYSVTYTDYRNGTVGVILTYSFSIDKQPIGVMVNDIPYELFHGMEPHYADKLSRILVDKIHQEMAINATDKENMH